MTLIELKNHIDSILKYANPNRKEEVENMEVCIMNHKPSMGQRSVTNVKGISQGFDWDKGRLFIVPEKEMVEREITK